MPPSPPTPRAAEMLYKEQLEAFAARAQDRLSRMPVDQGVVAVERFLEQEKNALQASARGLERAARGLFSRVTTHSKREVSTLLGVRLPADEMGDLRDVFAQRQVQLVQRAIADQVHLLRAAQFDKALLNARMVELGTMRGRFRLIASNETHKLHEAEVEHWAELAGEPGGWYVVHRDEALRPTHAAHAGKFFLFSERPSEMGEVNCRCRLIPGAERG